jgi:hypothetical protein
MAFQQYVFCRLWAIAIAVLGSLPSLAMAASEEEKFFESLFGTKDRRALATTDRNDDPVLILMRRAVSHAKGIKSDQRKPLQAVVGLGTNSSQVIYQKAMVKRLK